MNGNPSEGKPRTSGFAPGRWRHAGDPPPSHLSAVCAGNGYGSSQESHMVDQVLRIVVGVDGSAGSRAALRWALDQAGLPGGNVEAVAAWQDPYLYGHGYGWPSTQFDVAEVSPSRTSLLPRLWLRSWASRTDRRGDRPGRRGPASQVLLNRARSAQLLVVGKRGHGAFAGMLLGSVSQSCVQNATCPVAAIPEENGMRNRASTAKGSLDMLVAGNPSRTGRPSVQPSSARPAMVTVIPGRGVTPSGPAGPHSGIYGSGRIVQPRSPELEAAVILTIETHRINGAVRLDLRGEIDMDSAPALVQAITDALDAGAGEVVINLQAVTFCDCAGITTLLVGHRDALARRADFRVINPTGSPLRVLVVLDLHTLLTSRARASQLHRPSSTGC
ncbi:universal stress protein [Micromonosporaceae bacterium Da 78-11]